ncbi:MAG: AI-2E family transporter [Cyclobacteriaceae bacterium]|nr:AI-2E family transporter [Cyclobacteriaceae bacterium]
METTNSAFHQRLSTNLITLSILGAGLYIGQDLLLPIFFAILLGTLLLPASRYLLRKKVPESLSILIPLVLFFIVFSCLLYFLSYQVVHFFDDLPEIKQKINSLFTSIQRWFKQETKVTITKQNQFIKDFTENIKKGNSDFLGNTVATLTNVISYMVLLPIYTFLLMYYRSTIKQFLISTFKNGSEEKVTEVIQESTNVAQRFVLGLCLETGLVFALNTAGFLIIGIKYAVFLALLAALLNLIPYAGMLIANLLCMLVTLVSTDNQIEAIWVGVVLLIVQIFDNNIGMPLIVGSKVKINALVTIIGVLVGGALCGIPGMFLAIPGLAVMKVIFDRVPEMKAWGLLLSANSKKMTDHQSQL